MFPVLPPASQVKKFFLQYVIENKIIEKFEIKKITEWFIVAGDSQSPIIMINVADLKWSA